MQRSSVPCTLTEYRYQLKYDILYTYRAQSYQNNLHKVVYGKHTHTHARTHAHTHARTKQKHKRRTRTHARTLKTTKQKQPIKTGFDVERYLST